MDRPEAVVASAASASSPTRRHSPATRLLLRAGWAPAAVFLGHLVGSRFLGVYALIPWFDPAAHLFGGVAIAYFFGEAAAVLVLGSVAAPLRGCVHAALVTGGSSFAILLWEIQEFLQDRFLGTSFQSGVADTMGDVILGLSGTAIHLALASCRRSLGRPRGQ